MPTWGEVLKEIQGFQVTQSIDAVRRKYLAALAELTGRPVIAYYSSWLSGSQVANHAISDADMNAFMSAVHKLPRDQGLDLILHTPGGDLAATEAIVAYLRTMFGTDIRAIIPQIAMSAGTMIACACKSVVMGKQSSLGPINPQINGLPAAGVIAEFEKAVQEITIDPARTELWQVIIGKYHPTFLGECEKGIQWADSMVTDWLFTGMFKGKRGARKKAERTAENLDRHGTDSNHSRHLSIDDCIAAGLIVEKMEDNHDLQDLILTVHHSFIHTFALTPTIKIVENSNGAAMVLHKT